MTCLEVFAVFGAKARRGHSRHPGRQGRDLLAGFATILPMKADYTASNLKQVRALIGRERLISPTPTGGAPTLTGAAPD